EAISACNQKRHEDKLKQRMVEDFLSQPVPRSAFTPTNPLSGKVEELERRIEELENR
ncbi:MAG: polyhydroxyalkanoate synthesis regulator phasin, partial [Hyphomicrobiaceae bacterium]